MATILLVEDDELVTTLIQKVLRRAGYDLLTATNGMSAIEICRELGGALDLIVTDVVMPGLSGPEWIEEVESLIEDVPVIYMSGYTRDARSRRGLLVEHAEVLQKPFEIHEFLSIIEKSLGVRR